MKARRQPQRPVATRRRPKRRGSVKDNGRIVALALTAAATLAAAALIVWLGVALLPRAPTTDALRIAGAVLAFGVTACFATRLRLAARRSEEGGTHYVRSYAELSSLKSKAVRAQVNRMLLRMGWSWVLLCAPLLAYLPDSPFSLKMSGFVLLGCLLLGIILSALAYRQVEKIGSLESTDQLEERLRGPGRALDDADRAFVKDLRVSRLKDMQAGVPRSNRITLLLAIVAACLVPLLRGPAAWASGLSTTMYAILVAGLALTILVVYYVVTYRSGLG